MGITDKVSQIAGQMQEGVKNSSKSIFGFLMKIATGFMIGLTVALIGQEVMGYGTILFLFAMILVGAVLYKVMQNWTLGSVLIFDLICVLVALLLRMYILVAP